MVKSRRFATSVLLILQATETVSFNSIINSINYKPVRVQATKNRHRRASASAGASRQDTSPTVRSFVSQLSGSRYGFFDRDSATRRQSETSAVDRGVTAENDDDPVNKGNTIRGTGTPIIAVGFAGTKRSHSSFIGTSLRATDYSSSSVESSTLLEAPPAVTGKTSPAQFPFLLPSIRAPLSASILGRVLPGQQQPQQQQRPATTAAVTAMAFTPYPSDPIERFSGKKSAGGGASAAGVPSLLGRLATDLRSRTLGGETQGMHYVLPQQGGTDEGVKELCSAISRVEVKLSTDSPEVGQLRVSLFCWKLLFRNNNGCPVEDRWVSSTPTTLSYSM